MKKIITVLLSCIMLISLTAAEVFAYDFDDIRHRFSGLKPCKDMNNL